ncbi:hypothetical protein QIU19_09205 [Capnocytophaga canimorsus]|nr:hypothetical protein [Capnocytophaga canimorsus]WGU67681.1 hypothetical protein QIU19_09205 [Capnocytophaga canimorsus]
MFAGAEIQEDKLELTKVDRLGYDPKSNIYINTNYKKLKDDIEDVYHPDRNIAGGIPFDEGFQETQNRYVASIL